MSVQEHVESLRNKHAHLEHLIDEELQRPMPDQASVGRMKREKLRIKEEIERLREGAGVQGPRTRACLSSTQTGPEEAPFAFGAASAWLEQAAQC